MESISEDYGGCGVSPVSARATGGEESCAMLIKRECKDGEGVDSYSGSQQGLTNGACAGKKSRPIPPPLDLTVRNLDQSHEDVVHPLTSPKSPTQKHLPLRKRALSWSNLGEAPNSGGTFVSTSLDLPYGTGSSSVFERGSHCDNPEACSVPRYSNNLENVDSIPKPATPALKSTPPLKFSIASLGLEGLLTPASSSSSSQPSSVASSAEALDGHPLSPAKRSSRCYISSASASLSLPLDLTTSPYPYSPLVPTPVWGCFLHGTKIRFGSGEDGPWLSAEDLGRRMKDEPLTPAGSPSSDPGRSPLYVHKVERVTNGSDLTFAIVHFKVSENGPVSVFSAACAIDHPFFVKDGGWSAVFPDMMTGNYGLPGRELLIGDMVVQPSLAAPSPLPKSSGVLSGQPPECHTSLTPDLETRLKVFTFPPPPHMRVSEAMPTSPFLMTGSHGRMPTPHSPYPMHAPHRSVCNDRAGSSGVQSPGYQLPHFGAFSSSPGSASSSASASSALLSPMPFSAGMSSPNDLLMLSPPESPGMRRGIPGIPTEIDRTRRPMNGFMLFAKQFRQEMIQANPGKDNRSISILLGDAWKRLSSAQREGYSMCARQMAEEYKRAHPDCWKRKRTKVKQPKSVGQ